MTSYAIRILCYDGKTHHFSPDIDVCRILPGDSDGSLSTLSGQVCRPILSLEAAREKGIVPSGRWMEDYKKWNSFHLNPTEFKGQPVFSSRDALHEFNDTGAVLVSRLREELKHKKNVRVEDFQPLYSNIEVGDAVAAWWHIKDKNYMFVVPIQRLPVSDELKSRLMAWRFSKGKGWLDCNRCESLNKEGHDLEEHILWELNVRESKDQVDRLRVSQHLPSKQESLDIDSVHYSAAPVIHHPTGVAPE